MSQLRYVSTRDPPPPPGESRAGTKEGGLLRAEPVRHIFQIIAGSRVDENYFITPAHITIERTANIINYKELHFFQATSLAFKMFKKVKKKN
jgi:hypothetical protein